MHNVVNCCFDKMLISSYQWEFDLYDKNSFLTKSKKYSQCAEDSSETCLSRMKKLKTIRTEYLTF